MVIRSSIPVPVQMPDNGELVEVLVEVEVIDCDDRDLVRLQVEELAKLVQHLTEAFRAHPVEAARRRPWRQVVIRGDALALAEGSD